MSRTDCIAFIAHIIMYAIFYDNVLLYPFCDDLDRLLLSLQRCSDIAPQLCSILFTARSVVPCACEPCACEPCACERCACEPCACEPC